MSKFSNLLEAAVGPLASYVTELERQNAQLKATVKAHHEFRQGHDHDLYEPYVRTPLYTMSCRALALPSEDSRPYPPGTRLCSGGTLSWALGTISKDDVWEVQDNPNNPETVRTISLLREGVKVSLSFDLVELDENFAEVKPEPAPDLPASVKEILDRLEPAPVNDELNTLLRDLMEAAKFAALCDQDKAGALATGARRDADEWQRMACAALQKYLFNNPAVLTQHP